MADVQFPERCIFCPEGHGQTRDHVPPRSFFPTKLPPHTRLITVPSCRSCHSVSQRNDALIRNLFVSLEQTESTPYVRRDLLFKRDRSFDRHPAELRRLFQLTRLVEVRSPGGIVLRDDLAFDLEAPVVTAFLTRLCRALLWEEFKLQHFEGEFDWRMSVDPDPMIYEGCSRLGRFRKVHDVFAYGATQPRPPDPGWLIINFYGRFEIIARVVMLS
jgi:hypothetical protein